MHCCAQHQTEMVSVYFWRRSAICLMTADHVASHSRWGNHAQTVATDDLRHFPPKCETPVNMQQHFHSPHNDGGPEVGDCLQLNQKPAKGTLCTISVMPCRPRHGAVWRRGTVGRVSDLWSSGRGFKSWPGTRCKNPGQVSHTHVPLSPSSISWYRPKGGDALWLGSKGRFGSCVGGR